MNAVQHARKRNCLGALVPMYGTCICFEEMFISEGVGAGTAAWDAAGCRGSDVAASRATGSLHGNVVDVDGGSQRHDARFGHAAAPALPDVLAQPQHAPGAAQHDGELAA